MELGISMPHLGSAVQRLYQLPDSTRDALRFLANKAAPRHVTPSTLPREDQKIQKPLLSHLSGPTLVLELEEVLAQCRQKPLPSRHPRLTVHLAEPLTKASVYLRPFARLFLETVARLFTVVIFTSCSKAYMDQVLKHLDPEGTCVAASFHRDHCTEIDGRFLKDLSILGLSLARVVLVEACPAALALSPDNGVLIARWSVQHEDRELLDLLLLLRKCVYHGDFRSYLAQRFGLRRCLRALRQQPDLLNGPPAKNEVASSAQDSPSNHLQTNDVTHPIIEAVAGTSTDRDPSTERNLCEDSPPSPRLETSNITEAKSSERATSPKHKRRRLTKKCRPTGAIWTTSLATQATGSEPLTEATICTDTEMPMMSAVYSTSSQPSPSCKEVQPTAVVTPRVGTHSMVNARSDAFTTPELKPRMDQSGKHEVHELQNLGLSKSSLAAEDTAAVKPSSCFDDRRVALERAQPTSLTLDSSEPVLSASNANGAGTQVSARASAQQHGDAKPPSQEILCKVGHSEALVQPEATSPKAAVVGSQVEESSFTAVGSITSRTEDYFRDDLSRGAAQIEAHPFSKHQSEGRKTPDVAIKSVLCAAQVGENSFTATALDSNTSTCGDCLGFDRVPEAAQWEPNPALAGTRIVESSFTAAAVESNKNTCGDCPSADQSLGAAQGEPNSSLEGQSQGQFDSENAVQPAEHEMVGPHVGDSSFTAAAVARNTSTCGECTSSNHLSGAAQSKPNSSLDGQSQGQLDLESAVQPAERAVIRPHVQDSSFAAAAVESNTSACGDFSSFDPYLGAAQGEPNSSLEGQSQGQLASENAVEPAEHAVVGSHVGDSSFTAAAVDSNTSTCGDCPSFDPYLGAAEGGPNPSSSDSSQGLLPAEFTLEHTDLAWVGAQIGESRCTAAAVRSSPSTCDDYSSFDLFLGAAEIEPNTSSEGQSQGQLASEMAVDPADLAVVGPYVGESSFTAGAVESNTSTCGDCLSFDLSLGAAQGEPSPSSAVSSEGLLPADAWIGTQVGVTSFTAAPVGINTSTCDDCFSFDQSLEEVEIEPKTSPNGQSHGQFAAEIAVNPADPAVLGTHIGGSGFTAAAVDHNTSTMGEYRILDLPMGAAEIKFNQSSKGPSKGQLAADDAKQQRALHQSTCSSRCALTADSSPWLLQKDMAALSTHVSIPQEFNTPPAWSLPPPWGSKPKAPNRLLSVAMVPAHSKPPVPKRTAEPQSFLTAETVQTSPPSAAASHATLTAKSAPPKRRTTSTDKVENDATLRVLMEELVRQKLTAALQRADASSKRARHVEPSGVGSRIPVITISQPASPLSPISVHSDTSADA